MTTITLVRRCMRGHSVPKVLIVPHTYVSMPHIQSWVLRWGYHNDLQFDLSCSTRVGLREYVTLCVSYT